MTNKSYTKIILSFVILLLMLVGVSPTYATISRVSAVLSTDRNGDGIAGIGDVVILTCISDTDDDAHDEGYPYVYSDMLGIAPQTLERVGEASNRYTALITIGPGSIDSENASTGAIGKDVEFFFQDKNASTKTARLKVDNRRPSSNLGPILTNTYSGNNNTFKVGDELKLEINLDTTDTAAVYANLSSLGLSSNYRLNKAETDSTFRLQRIAPNGVEGTDLIIPITAVDYAGNSTTWSDIAINIDTIPPVIREVTVINAASGGGQKVKLGENLKLSVTVDKYDNDNVTASNTLLLDGETAVPIDTGISGVLPTVGNNAYYGSVIYVTKEGAPYQYSYIDVYVTDDAGNVTAGRTNYFYIDTVNPNFSNGPMLDVIKPRPYDDLNAQILIVDDVLRIYGDMSDIYPDVTIYADLSAIGGANNQIVPFKDSSTAPNVATTTFELLYTIADGSSEYNIPRTFSVKALTQLGNEIAKVTMPPIYVDNTVPILSGVQAINETSGGNAVKNGDTISIQAIVGGNMTRGSVYVDLSAVGGGAEEPMTLSTTDTYTTSFTVTTDASGASVDRPIAFNVTARDYAGNRRIKNANTLNIDTEIPVVLVATYTSNGTGEFVKVGDKLTFKVQLASSTAAIHDGETVTIDLTPLGGNAETDMMYNAGWYTYSTTVQNGTLTGDTDFRFVVKDNAGNAVSRLLPVPIVNKKPVVGTMGVNFITDKNVAGTINIGDNIEFIIPVDEDPEGYCLMDLSIVGSDSAVILMNYDDTRKRYYATWECREATYFNNSYVFTAAVYDKAGNVMNSLSAPFKVDCVPPRFLSDNLEFTNSTKGSVTKNGIIYYNKAIIGTELTFRVRVDTAFTDYNPPTLDLSLLGGSSVQNMNNVGNGVFSYKHTVTEGYTDGEGLKVTCYMTDTAGNEVKLETEREIWVDNCPVQINSLSYTLAIDDNGNNIVNLGAATVNEVISATDTVKVIVEYSDIGSLSVDLTQFGYSGFIAYEDLTEIEPERIPTGYRATLEIQPRRGSTNGENAYCNIRIVDADGNVSTMKSTNYIMVDNYPPRFQSAPILSISVDNGNVGEVNINDVVQVKATVYNNDGLEPFIDPTELYTRNGLVPPDWIVFPSSTTSTYTYTWTVRDSFGTDSFLEVIAADVNGNKTVVKTNNMVFLTKEPSFRYAYAEVTRDVTPSVENPNGIVNPGDTIKFSCAFNSLYNAENTSPAAVVLVDVRGLASSVSVEPSIRRYNVDGDSKAIWLELTQSPSSPMVYTGEFTAEAADMAYLGLDTNDASFTFVVLHPTDNTLSTAKQQGNSRDGSAIAVDTIPPKIDTNSFTVTIENDNNDNPIGYININDRVGFETTISNYEDLGSATIVVYGQNRGGIRMPYFRTQLLPRPSTSSWFTSFVVATGTIDADNGAYDVWAKCDDLTLACQVVATDDADNTSVSAIKVISPQYKLDNTPPLIPDAQVAVTPYNMEYNVSGVEDYKWIANVANSENIGSSTIRVTMTVTGVASYAYVDLSPIGGSSTYRLEKSGNTFSTIDDDGSIREEGYVHFPIPLNDLTAELATYTLSVFAGDDAGNVSRANPTKCKVAVDSKRPELLSAVYGQDGMSILTLNFSEPIYPDTFDFSNKVRLGRTSDHKDSASTVNYVKLSVDNDDNIMNTSDPSNQIQILLGSVASGKIADWKSDVLYVSIANDDTTNGESSVHTPIARDKGGNWLVPVPRLTFTTVTTEDDYLTRPNIIDGSYDGSDEEEANFLYLTFDKTVNGNSITTDTLNNLAVWYNVGSANETLLNRYRLNAEFAGDTFDVADQYGVSDLNTIRIRLSENAKQWLAVTYGNRASQMRLAVRDNKNNPLIRDSVGNRVNEILPYRAIPASFTPLTTTFGLGETLLDLSDPANPTLTIHSASDRKFRLYENGYSGSTLPLTTPADLSGIIICSTNNTSTGKYLSLGSSAQTGIVNWSKFKELNANFAATTVVIPLEAQALKTMLSWGTKDFYLSGNANAFKDCWGNGSDAYPDQYSNSAELIPTILPAGGGESMPRIISAAIQPLAKDEPALFKGQAAGSIYYEIAFDTANVATDVKVPIDRSIQPNMYMYRQSDWDYNTLTLKPGASPIDTGAFVSWLDHIQGGITRTAIRFVSSASNIEDGVIDREPVILYLDKFADIFGNETVYNAGTGFNVASMAYNLSRKRDSAAYINGFEQTASSTMIFDNCRPTAITATSTNLLTRENTNMIGLLAAGNLKTTVTFSEPMNTTSAPVLMLRNGGNVIMTFGRPKWIDSTHAEYTNSSAFTMQTVQGEAVYYVSGGFDEAGNLGNDIDLAAEPVIVKSRGPEIESIKVSTLRVTTSNNVTDTDESGYYSPLVSSDLTMVNPEGIATITISFVVQPEDATGTIAIFASNDTMIAECEAAPRGSIWYANWDGRINGADPFVSAGQQTYEVRFYDQAGNEGTKRGTIIYDTWAPRVVTPWTFPNSKTAPNGKVYTNGNMTIQSTLSAAETVRVRLTSPSYGYQLYTMSNTSGTTFSLNFDGKDNNGAALAEGEYQLNIVDMAGNLGVTTSNIAELSSATIVIDKTAPNISEVKMHRMSNTGAPLPLAGDSPAEVTSFNSNRNWLYIGFDEVGAGTRMEDGEGIVKISAGSEIIRELVIRKRGDAFPRSLYAIWDGKDSYGRQVEDGTYSFVITDLAGNQSTYSDNTTISVVRSVFKVESVEQVRTQGIRINFGHNLNTDRALATGHISVSGLTLGISSVAYDPDNSNAILATFSRVLSEAEDGSEVTVTVAAGTMETTEGDVIAAGNNTGKFTVVSKGPQIVGGAPNYEGITSQKEFNLIFDKQVVFDLNTISSPSLNPANYTIITSNATVITVDSVSRGADVKTVKLTVSNDLSDEITYTLTASNITDQYGNKGTSTISFVGRDVTPPNISLAAFSNPANEYDITILLGADEALGSDPLITIAQSGTTAVSTTLRLVTKDGLGTYKYVYSGGVHLSSSYSGVATIRAVASDKNGNSANQTIYFTTAFINSSLRASVESHDGKLSAVFEPGTLKENAMVLIMPESLNSAVTGEATASLRSSMRGSITARANVIDKAADELVPVATEAYALVVPAKKLNGTIALSFKTNASELTSDAGIYCDEGNGWKLLDYVAGTNEIKFNGKAGTYAIMRDVTAPRAVMDESIVAEPIRVTRPVFAWNIEEYASGVNNESISVIIDGKKLNNAMADNSGSVIKFMPENGLDNGEHEISLRISDRAGNECITPAVRFDVLAPLEIYQVIQYPNPAKNRMNIRFTTNINTLTSDNVRIRIYDVSGHMVADRRNIDMSGVRGALGGKYYYDCRWDLINLKGKKVANGVYFAKIEVTDPSGLTKKAKFTQKLAVLK